MKRFKVGDHSTAFCPHCVIKVRTVMYNAPYRIAKYFVPSVL